MFQVRESECSREIWECWEGISEHPAGVLECLSQGQFRMFWWVRSITYFVGISECLRLSRLDLGTLKMSTRFHSQLLRYSSLVSDTTPYSAYTMMLYVPLQNQFPLVTSTPFFINWHLHRKQLNKNTCLCKVNNFGLGKQIYTWFVVKQVKCMN